MDQEIRPTICVLTGDIVRSSRLDEARLNQLMDSLESCSKKVIGWTRTPSPPMERYRGDGWQLALTDPMLALRAGLLLRASLRCLDRVADSRISFGIGPGKVGRSLAASSGPAFERSGTLLEAMRGPDRWAFDNLELDPPVQRLMSGLFIACEAVSSHWTRRQAEVFSLMATPDEPTHAEVASRLGVRAQTVQDHFAKAGGRALSQILDIYEHSRCEKTA